MLLSILFSLHCILIYAQTAQPINNATETILSGTYIINTTSHNATLDDIHNAIQSLHKCTLLTLPFYTNGNAMGMESNPIQLWTSLQSEFNLSISDINAMYSDIDALNHKLHSNDHNTVEILSNFIICRDDIHIGVHLPDICSHKIGPVPNDISISALQPVAIHQQFDVDSIVISLDDASMDRIMVHISYYRISNNTDGAVEDRARCPFVSAHPMFPNATTSGCVGVQRQFEDHKQHIGIGWFVYDDVEKLLDDAGDPQYWKDRFYEYYFELETTNYDYVFYLGHIGAVCSNQNICDVYLSGGDNASVTNITTTETVPQAEEKNTWKTISIVFIIAFCIVLLVLLGMLVQYCGVKCCGLDCGGVSEQETKQIGGKRYIQTSTHDRIH